MLTDEELRYLSMAPFNMPPLFGVDLMQFIPAFKEHGIVKQFKKREMFLHLGQKTKNIKVLISGTVLESSSNANGLEKGILCFPSYPIAFSAAIHQQPTVYSATAFTDVTVISIPYDSYIALMQQNREILEHSLRFIAFDSRNSNVTILQNCSCSTTEKVYQAIYYYYLACQHFEPLRTVKLTQNLLAILSGVHRTSVAHVMKELKEQEIINLEKKDLQVLEPQILKDIAFENLI